MAKTITFTYDDTQYTLEFTRATVAKMENEGFNPADIANKPLSTIPVLFAGAFKAHHRFTPKETIDAIYAGLEDKDGLLQKLAEMYAEPVETLLDGGNVKWEASW